MKKIEFGILVAFLFVFVGCIDDDGYSLNDMWVGFGIIRYSDAASPAESLRIVMDNNDILVSIASNYPPNWLSKFDNGDRVLLNYTILEEKLNGDNEVEFYYVKVNSIKDVLMKGIMDITLENEDSIGNDAIVIEDYWMKDSLLNFKLKYWGYNKIHFLNLVKQPGDILDENQPIELELRHNANEDDEAISYTAFVSFSLNGLRIDGIDSVQFIVTSTDYDGNEFSEEGVFNYGNLDD